MRLLTKSMSVLWSLVLSSSSLVAHPAAHYLGAPLAQKKKQPARKSRKIATRTLSINGRPLINTNQVLNSKALSLPEPVYPPEAKARGIYGKVKVEVLIGGLGELISAKAISGPRLLRPAAEDAARLAKFGATMHGHWPEVIIRGFLVYRFPPNTKERLEQ